MPTRRASLLSLVAFAATALTLQAEDLQPIFNGKDLTGWQNATDNRFWKVVDGILVGENDEALTGNVLHTEKAYHDVIIETEVRWQGHIDSGIMVRKPEIQLQIGISGSLKKDMTCSFYIGKGGYPEPGQAKGKEAVLKEGEWNKIRLVVKGDTYNVWLNGQQVVTDYVTAAFPEAAPIGLQIHPKLKMKVEYRNIKVQALD